METFSFVGYNLSPSADYNAFGNVLVKSFNTIFVSKFRSKFKYKFELFNNYNIITI